MCNGLQACFLSALCLLTTPCSRSPKPGVVGARVQNTSLGVAGVHPPGTILEPPRVSGPGSPRSLSLLHCSLGTASPIGGARGHCRGAWLMEVLSLQLFDLIYREETLFNVIKSVTRNGRSILLTALLALILVYLFSIVGFLFLKDDFILEVDRLPGNHSRGLGDFLSGVGVWGDSGHAQVTGGDTR
jgi:hypothetical protein